MSATRCPDCDAAIQAEPSKIRDGAVMTCGYCGYLGVWRSERSAWCTPTPEEHAKIIQNEEVMERLTEMMAMRGWVERDRANLRALISRMLTWRFILWRKRTLAALIADYLIKHGYHSHPREGEQ